MLLQMYEHIQLYHVSRLQCLHLNTTNMVDSDIVPPEIQQRLDTLLNNMTTIQSDNQIDNSKIDHHSNEYSNKLRSQLTSYLDQFHTQYNIQSIIKNTGSSHNDITTDNIYDDNEMDDILKDEQSTQIEVQRLTDLLTNVTTQADAITKNNHNQLNHDIYDGMTEHDDDDIFALTSTYDTIDTNKDDKQVIQHPNSNTNDQQHRLQLIDHELQCVNNQLPLNQLIGNDTHKQLSAAQIHYLLTHPHINSTAAFNNLSAIDKSDRLVDTVDVNMLLSQWNTTQNHEIQQFIYSRQLANQLRTESKSNKTNESGGTELSALLSDDSDDELMYITNTQKQSKSIHIDNQVEQMLNHAIAYTATNRQQPDDDTTICTTETVDTRSQSPVPHVPRAVSDKPRITVEQKLSRMLDKMNDIQHSVKAIPVEYRHNQSNRSSLNDTTNKSNHNKNCKQNSFLPNIQQRPHSNELTSNKLKT